MVEIANCGLTLPAAAVHWDGSQCFSADHNDRYYSADGISEVQRVFMAPVQLEERFAATTNTFTCAELGFGTGLSAMVLAERFCAMAPATAQLHLISVERAPLNIQDMQHMARHWQAALPMYQELLQHYPPRLSGWHRLHLRGGRVRLSVFFGEAESALADIIERQRVPVDHWLLDGFAPTKNPSLWSPELMRQISRLATRGSSIATYTAVGRIRRDLESAGFEMRKVDQMPAKLHSLAGKYVASGCARFAVPDRVQVLGGGIAAASVARGLVERGIPVTLVEPSGRLAGYASRIPAAAVHGRLRDDGSPAAAWQALSYHYSHRRLQAFAGYHPTGVLQISGPNAEPARLAALLARYSGSGDWLSAGDARQHRFRPAKAALQFAIGGVAQGKRLVNSLANHPLISFQTSTDESALQVLANGFAVRTHRSAKYLEITSLAGQAEVCSHSSPPEMPIVGAGYMAPCPGGMVIGSTYEYKQWLDGEARTSNLKPWLDSGKHRASFRAHRTITSDRSAIVGKLYDKDLVAEPNLRVATGFGSTGMTSAPFAGECIAAELSGEFAPITTELETALSSLRFRTRQARRGPRMNAEP